MSQIVFDFSVLSTAFVVAYLLGKIARWIGLPKVTAYLLTGVILGPMAFNFVTTELYHKYEVINQLAFGLILFSIGGEFHKSLLEKVTRRQIRYTLYYISITLGIVFVICFVSSSFTQLTWVERFAFSLFLSFVALDCAPPTSLLVIKESEAKGPLTSLLLVFLCVSSIVALSGSELAETAIIELGLWSGTKSGMGIGLIRVVGLLFLSMGLGWILGFALGYWEQRESKESEVVFAVLCLILLGQVLAVNLGLEPLIVSLVMGFTLVNVSPEGKAMHEAMKSMGGGIYVLFFVLAGAHLNFLKGNVEMTLLCGGYVIARVVGLTVGGKIASRMLTGEGTKLKESVGFCLLSHAGGALAIVGTLSGRKGELAESIVGTVVGSIIIFELVGPLLLKRMLVKSGEVVKNKRQFITASALSVKDLGRHFLNNVFGQRRKLVQPNNDRGSIKFIVDRKVKPVFYGATIQQLTDLVKQQKSRIYPIVDKQCRYLGVLDLSLLSTAIDDPFRFRYACAGKFLKFIDPVVEEESLGQASKALARVGFGVVPVVEDSSFKFVGFLYEDELLVWKRNTGWGR